MLDNYIVIGIVIALVEMIKLNPKMKTELGSLLIPVLVFAMAGAVNVANAFIFGDMALLEALKDGLTLGAVSGGLYSMGKTYMDKSDIKIGVKK